MAALTTSMLRAVDPDTRERLSSVRASAPLAVELVRPVSAKRPPSPDVDRGRVAVAPEDVASPGSSSPVLGPITEPRTDALHATSAHPERVATLLRQAFVERFQFDVDIGRGPLRAIVVVQTDAGRYRVSTSRGTLGVRVDEVQTIALDPGAVERVRAAALELATRHAIALVCGIDGRRLIGRIASGGEGKIGARRISVLDPRDGLVGMLKWHQVARVSEAGGGT